LLREKWRQSDDQERETAKEHASSMDHSSARTARFQALKKERVASTALYFLYE
jgi:hypothetical protein